MEKCEHSKVYEQIGKIKVDICMYKGLCNFKGESFTSTEDDKKYFLCRTNGLVEKTETPIEILAKS